MSPGTTHIMVCASSGLTRKYRRSPVCSVMIAALLMAVTSDAPVRLICPINDALAFIAVCIVDCYDLSSYRDMWIDVDYLAAVS